MTIDYITVKEIAEIKGVSRQAIDKRLNSSKIVGRRFGKTRVYTKEEVKPILEAEFRS